jgi:class 3 adenylate cyclase
MEAPPLERKLAAILAADVEGYSRLMNADEEQTLATLTSHRTIIDALIEKAHGQIFGTAGDSVLAEFPSIVHAFNSAVAIQRAMWRANQELVEDRRMNFRIGINVGDVLVKNGDIFGDGVNIAARLEGLADVGGICVTRGVRDHLRDRVDATFEDLGEHSIKNIARPLRVFRVIFDPEAEPGVDLEPLPDKTPEGSSSVEQWIGHEPDTDDEGGRVEVAFWESVQRSGEPGEYALYLERFPHGQFADLAKARLENGESGDPDPGVEVAFWETVQQSGDPAEYALYLERFPHGQFADLAKARLENGQSGDPDPGVEVAFWETVRDAGNPKMVEAYLGKYPKGQFSDLAHIMLAELRGKAPG